MKQIVKIMMAALIVASLQPIEAKERREQSYNLTRAIEEAQQGNNKEAMEYLEKEIADMKEPVTNRDSDVTKWRKVKFENRL